MKGRNDRFRTVLHSESPFSSPLIIIGFGMILLIVLFSIPYFRKNHIDYGMAIGAFILLVAYVVSTWKVILRLTRSALILEKHLAGQIFQKVYELSKIEDLKFEEHVKSDSYTSVGQIRVFGTDRTPESWKTYYYHAEVLSFNYEGKNVKFGEYQSAFNAQELYQLLNNAKQEEGSIK